MLERLAQQAMTATLGVFCLAGVVEGIRIDEPSVAVLFALAFGVGALIARERAAYRPIRVRPDLREWLDDTASVTGDTIEELSNTAISNYRSRLAGQPCD